MRHVNEGLRSLTLALATAGFLLTSAIASVAEAQAVGGSGWLAAAQQAAGPLAEPTPTLSDDNGPATTPAFETVSGALVVNGSQTVQTTDVATGGLLPLKLVRTYNYAGMGKLFAASSGTWSSNLDIHLDFESLSNGVYQTILAFRSDGSRVEYQYNAADSRWENSSPDTKDWIVKNGDGSYSLIAQSGAVENYDASGRVLSTRDSTGLGLSFAYDGNGQLQTVTTTDGRTLTLGWSNGQVVWVQDPNGNRVQYGYTPLTYYPADNLTSVTYPNGDQITYAYAGNSSLLTAIYVNGALYRSFSYVSGISGVAASSYGANQDVERATFSYASNSTTVTSGTGAATTYTYQKIQGRSKLTQVTTSGVTGAPAMTATIAYDSNGHPSSMTDPRGITTHYQYSSEGLLLDKITGIDPNNPGQRRETAYTWDTAKDRITEIKRYGDSQSDPISDTVYTYYPETSPAKNRIESITVTNLSANGAPNQTQTTTYSYQFYASGMPSQITADGPLAGATGYLEQYFDSHGNLTSTVDALGFATTYSGYNGLGLPGSVTDPNGYIVNLGYDARGRLTSVSRMINGATATTSYLYDGLNHLTQVKYPDGGWVNYAYDAAGRLTQRWTDQSSGETTHTFGCETVGSAYQVYDAFAYDSVSDLISQSTAESDTRSRSGCDGNGSTTTETTYYSHGWSYDEIGRQTGDSGNNGQHLTYTYDADGNVASVTDALGHTWSYTYNAHNQVQTATAPDGGVATFTYDGAGHPASVTDPDGHTTRYAWDGFGQLTAVSSPDSGVTAFVYDGRGRLTRLTRADGTTTALQYDADNRITQAAAGSLVQTYTYDTCANGKTRLCGYTDPSGNTAYSYTPDGQLASQTQSIGGASYVTSWAYDNRDRVVAITYPGGNQVGYVYDSQSHVIGMTATIGGAQQTVASAIAYQAHGFGPPLSMSLGDGSNVNLSYDTDARVTGIVAGNVENLSYTYDGADRITQITDHVNTGLTETLGYDGVSRLTNVASSGLGNQSLAYDANGNRTSHTAVGGTDTYTLTAGSNQIGSISGARSRSFAYDADGNVTGIAGWGGNRSFTYDAFNHLAGVTTAAGTTHYLYNALGQRVRKTGAGGNFSDVYAPDGTLLGETANGGSALSTEYLYLPGAGDAPAQLIGVIRNNTLYFVHDDHLGRPQVVTNSSGTVVWQAANAAFDRTVTTDTFGGLNLGFPGQYFDQESGLYYNGFRYYDPTTGRYLQPDPLGLAVGMNPFVYGFDNPMAVIDPTGLLGLGDAGILFILGGGELALLGPGPPRIIGAIFIVAGIGLLIYETTSITNRAINTTNKINKQEKKQEQELKKLEQPMGSPSRPQGAGGVNDVGGGLGGGFNGDTVPGREFPIVTDPFPTGTVEVGPITVEPSEPAPPCPTGQRGDCGAGSSL